MKGILKSLSKLNPFRKKEVVREPTPEEQEEEIVHIVRSSEEGVKAREEAERKRKQEEEAEQLRRDEQLRQQQLESSQTHAMSVSELEEGETPLDEAAFTTTKEDEEDEFFFPAFSLDDELIDEVPEEDPIIRHMPSFINRGVNASEPS